MTPERPRRRRALVLKLSAWLLAGLRLAAFCVALLSPGSAIASKEMLQLGDLPLIVHASPERARLGAELARRGHGEVERIARDLGLPVPPRIDAWLLPRKGEQEPSDFGLPSGPAWAAGLALRDRPVIILRTDEERGESGNEVATTLTHELVHAIMSEGLRGAPARTPSWWDEGLAAHLAYEWRLVQSVHVVGLALTGSYVPLGQIEDAFPVGGPRVQWAYLESFAFLQWLGERSGAGAVGVVHAGLLQGKSFRAAFIDAYGDSPTRLEEVWRTEFLWRYRWIPILTSSSTLWGAVMIAFFVAGVARRRQTTARIEAWEDDESDELDGARDPPDEHADGAPGEDTEPR